MFWRSTAAKPGNSTRMANVPGSRFGALYNPASSVVRERTVPRSTSRMEMLAPGMTAPLWSATLPKIRPVLPCVNTNELSKRTAKDAPRIENVFTKTSFAICRLWYTPSNEEELRGRDADVEERAQF